MDITVLKSITTAKYSIYPYVELKICICKRVHFVTELLLAPKVSLDWRCDRNWKENKQNLTRTVAWKIKGR